jgi:hypothetical protein
MDEAVEREVRGLRIVPYDIPRGCVGAYYPEVNALIPLSHHDRRAGTPAYKATPVRLARSAMSQRPQPEAMERPVDLAPARPQARPTELGSGRTSISSSLKTRTLPGGMGPAARWP